MKIGYARVSTLSQDFDIQIEKLESSGCEIIYKEKITGTIRKRPEFEKALKQLKEGDTFVVTRLDRFARSLSDSISIVTELFNKGINIEILNLGKIEDTPTGKLIFTIFSAFSEFENSLRRERIIEGKERAKQKKDYRDGRPRKYTEERIEYALEVKKNHTWAETERLTGIPQSTLYSYKKRKEQK